MSFWKSLRTDNPHVELRPESLDQADVIYDAIQDNFDYLSKWVYWVNKDYSRQDNFDAIKDNKAAADKQESYIACIYYDGEFAGCVDARVNADRQWEVGYWIIEKFAGLGLATACTKVLMDYVHDEIPGIEKFVLFTAIDNSASNRVAEKLGFHKVGEINNQKRENQYVKEYR